MANLKNTKGSNQAPQNNNCCAKNMKYYLQTFGCQMNKSDSERIAFVLEKMNFKKTLHLSRADLVVINMCSVRQSAVDRVYGLIEKLKVRPSLKSSKKSSKVGPLIILTGCILPQDRKKLHDKVDLIFNIKDLPRILTSSRNLDSNNLRVKPLSLPKNYLEIAPLVSSFPSAYVPIMTGCNNFCAYCVVPYLRGREYSRSPFLILKEIKNLLAKDFKRIILLGQNVNSYQGEIKNKKLIEHLEVGPQGGPTSKITKTMNFSDLLKKIADLPGKFWLSFITSHPKDLSDELIEMVFSRKTNKICKYFHLPIQSGSDKILKKMNRDYTVKQYEKIIQKIKIMAKQKKLPVAISTDVIVGFPGETIKDFDKTASLLKKINYDMAYISKYSPRPLTAASKFKDNVNSFEKKRRQKKLFEILKKSALNNNKKYLNKEVDVLIMGDKKKYLPTGQADLFGETSAFKKVKINVKKDSLKKTKNLIGEFSRVKITKVTPWGLTGLLVPFY